MLMSCLEYENEQLNGLTEWQGQLVKRQHPFNGENM